MPFNGQALSCNRTSAFLAGEAGYAYFCELRDSDRFRARLVVVFPTTTRNRSVLAHEAQRHRTEKTLFLCMPFFRGPPPQKTYIYIYGGFPWVSLSTHKKRYQHRHPFCNRRRTSTEASLLWVMHWPQRPGSRWQRWSSG